MSPEERKSIDERFAQLEKQFNKDAEILDGLLSDAIDHMILGKSIEIHTQNNDEIKSKKQIE
jgi:hypothetical protein